MIDIAQHIEYLLMRHDCVVVPGLGAFLVNDEPARYVAETHSFLPPSRTIGFNPEVRHNDALLSGSISRRERVSLEAARNRLDMEVASLRCQLDVCGEVPIANLGLLVRGDSPEYPVFEPSECSLPVSRYSYFNVVDAELIRQDDENLCEKVLPPHRSVAIPLPLKIVASVIMVMVTFGILYSTTSLVDSSNVNSAMLDTGISRYIEDTVVGENLAMDDVVSNEIVLNIALPPTTDVQSAISDPHSLSLGRYLLVVASFPNRILAQRHKDYIGDDNLGIIEMDDNYRVFAGSASDIADARSKASSLSAQYPNIWICRR